MERLPCHPPSRTPCRLYLTPRRPAGSPTYQPAPELRYRRPAQWPRDRRSPRLPPVPPQPHLWSMVAPPGLRSEMDRPRDRCWRWHQPGRHPPPFARPVWNHHPYPEAPNSRSVRPPHLRPVDLSPGSVFRHASNPTSPRSTRDRTHRPADRRSRRRFLPEVRRSARHLDPATRGEVSPSSPYRLQPAPERPERGRLRKAPQARLRKGRQRQSSASAEPFPPAHDRL